MIFEQRQPLKRLGRIGGYVTAYLVFTTVLFFMLTLLEKLPGSWSYFHMVAVTGSIAILGLAVKRLLK